MKKETIEIEVPSGKKIKINPMEKGMLFIFEDKNSLEILQDDMEYIRNTILQSMGIPKKYFGNELEQQLERQRCINDKTRIYMIEKYFTIYDHKTGEYIPFKLMEHQKLILRSLVENNGTIVKSYRQSGNTLLMSAYYACEMILNESTDILLITSSKDCSCEVIKKVKVFIEQWSKATNKVIFDIQNRDEIKLLHGANIRYINTTSTNSLLNINVKYVTHVFYDNAAFIEFRNDLLYWLEDNLPKNIKTTIISTDQKSDNWFKTQWNKTYKLNNSINGNYDCGEFNKIELEWFNDPRYNKDLKWVKVQQNVVENGIKKVKQAYLPTNEWYVGMCKILGNKQRIEQEIGIGYNPNENPIEVEKEDIREQIYQLNNRLKNLNNNYYN